MKQEIEIPPVKCEGCKWWSPVMVIHPESPKVIRGECRRFPPKGSCVWPETRPDDFCGEAYPKHYIHNFGPDGWYTLEEKPPLSHQILLVQIRSCSSGGCFVRTAVYYPEASIWKNPDGSQFHNTYDPYEITHWQPLPEPRRDV